MSAKKKPMTKTESNKLYLARKKAKEEAALFEAALEAPASTQTVEVEQAPVEPADTFMDAEGFNPYAPDMGLGEDPLNQETGEFRTPEAPTTDAEPVEPQQTTAEPPSVPVEPVKTPVRTQVPKPLPESLEGPSDAQIVERLINAINYLYPIARLTKGIRGPQPDKVEKIIGNIKLARNLLERL